MVKSRNTQEDSIILRSVYSCPWVCIADAFKQMGPRFLHKLIFTRATIQGVLARDYIDRYTLSDNNGKLINDLSQEQRDAG